jgi:holo-[acyl-carrier protein] synthase
MKLTAAHLRHGIDLVEIDQLRGAMARNPAFEARVFTASERAYCHARPDPLPHFAARFAAKEAALKALGIGITPLGIDRGLGEVEVRRHGSAPVLALSGRPQRRADALGVRPAAVSLSHAGTFAIASVLLARAEDGP